MTPIPAFSARLPARVVFGRGASTDAAPEIAAFGGRILLVHGRSAARAAPLRKALEAEGATVSAIACDREPTLAMIEDARAAIGAALPHAVVALGGGAAIDFGKALAAVLPSDATNPIEHLEGVGAGRPLVAPPLPFVAVPTTAGTGAEATKNAVIAVPEHRVKVSLRDDRMVPTLAVIDPALTDGTPKAQTLASGLDAVTQVIEPYLSTRANPLTDALARPAIGTGLRALVRLMEHGEDPDARDALAWVAHASGIALANAGLGAVHGLAGVLGGETGAAHGVICARLLPGVLAALDRSAETPETRRRLSEVRAEIDAAVPGGFDGFGRWMAGHGLPALPALDEAGLERVAEAARGASSMKASPVSFDAPALAAIVANA